jgi:hypothetical protein
LQFEFHGAVYVCNECLSELARTVGWITPAQAEVLKEQAETARREAFRLQVANDNFRALEEAINGYVRDRARNRHPSNREPDLVLFPGTEYASESDRDDEVGSPSGADQLGAGEGTSAESSDDSGVDELPPDASDNGEFRLDI